MNHIELAKKTDALLIAPATAAIIGKIANGIVTGFSDPADSEDTENSKGKEQMFETNISSNSLIRGSIIINTDGAVIGIAQGGSISITPATAILLALADTGGSEEEAGDEVLLAE